ncbi:MAG: hypothetical protein AAGF90_19880 [Pseudomonadota bacterium]
MRLTAAFILLATSAAAGGDRPPLVCFGAEPFWSLDLGAETAVFTAPDQPQIDYAIPDVRRAEGRFWPQALTLLSPQDTAILLLRPAACSDTMSDVEHEWTVDMLTQRRGEAVVYTGCCRAAAE